MGREGTQQGVQARVQMQKGENRRRNKKKREAKNNTEIVLWKIEKYADDEGDDIEEDQLEPNAPRVTVFESGVGW